MNKTPFDFEAAGKRMQSLMAELWPLHRSMAGPGLRETLKRIQKEIPIEIHEVPTGTRIYDWRVPQEWECRDAFIKDEKGVRIVDWRRSNLHVVNHSTPIHKNMLWSELKPFLHFCTEHPDWIPYRTAYFKKEWGFCLSRRQFRELESHENRTYEVVIDASFTDGALSYGELYLPGKRAEEVLISCHVCHPSLANDNLSATALVVCLADYLAGSDRNLSYRLIYLPATIGAITWLSRNRARTDRIKYGLVLAGLGDPGSLTYKKSRSGSEIDRVVSHVLKNSGNDYAVLEFRPDGYDERQYCSPGFDLPVGRLTRTPDGEYPEYHTSADNLDFVRLESLSDSLKAVLATLDILDQNRSFINPHPWCEPPLGRHGLYHSPGFEADLRPDPLAVRWVLNLSDGKHSLFEISERSGLSFEAVLEASEVLSAHSLLSEKP
jgi:aminopeptidase-like protein